MTTDNENILFQILKDRYLNNQIYTYAGDILVALRPQKLLNIYNKTVMEGYSQWTDESLRLNHVFSVGQNVYEAMLLEPDDESSNQSVLIRGESGSGKTESCKYLLKFWSHVYCNDQTLKDKLLNVFPILEAFGNACTTTNSNSSRFAMALTLCFNANFVTGLKLTTFLLDQWRLTYHFKSELNFHVLHYASATEKLNGKLNKDYKLLKNKSAESNEVLRDKYKQLFDSMKIVGFSEKEVMNVDLLIQFILNLGNISFQRTKLKDVTLDEESKQMLHAYSEMLGIDGDELEQNLYSKCVSVDESETSKMYSRDEAEDFLDLLVRSLYCGLFSWLIHRINDLLCPKSTDINGTTPKPNIAKNRFIDILDFYSIESQEINSMEQFMMNMTAELAHCMSIENYCQISEEMYTIENVLWTGRKLPHNHELMKLIYDDNEFVELLERETTKDEDWVKSLVDKNRQRINYNVKMANVFSIKHYNAEIVKYDSRTWATKNANKLTRRVLNVFENAENFIVSVLFKYQAAAVTSAAVDDGTPKPIVRTRNMSLMAQFKKSMQQMMSKYTTSHLTVVCCVKTQQHINNSNNINVFDEKYVKEQFIGLGLLDIMKCYKSVHQLTIPYEDFVQKYSSLATSISSSMVDMTCDIMTSSSSSSSSSSLKDCSWAFGQTMIFLKNNHLKELNRLLFDRNNVKTGPGELETYYVHISKEAKSNAIYAIYRTETDINNSNNNNNNNNNNNSNNNNNNEPVNHDNLESNNDKNKTNNKNNNNHVYDKLKYNPDYVDLVEEALYSQPIKKPKSQQQDHHQQQQQQPPQQRQPPPRPEIPPRPLPTQANKPTGQMKQRWTIKQQKSITRGRFYPSLDDLQNEVRALERQDLEKQKQRKQKEQAAPRFKEEDDDDEDDYLEDVSKVMKEVRKIDPTIYGELGSKSATVAWFKKTQTDRVPQNNGRFPDWFHGMITRNEAERLLAGKPIGCYLIRVGESRIGYSLSFRDKEKCKHYMVDELVNGSYKVVGEKLIHKDLLQLTEYYKKNFLSNWKGHLSTPCPQESGRCDYMELVMTAEEKKELNRLMSAPRVEPSAPSKHYEDIKEIVEQKSPGQTVPPALPKRFGAKK